jgi:protocatechuate 3,4-dioxygenase beta subunit
VLKGRLLSKQGQPLAAHRIEIWQCDVNGRYFHTADRRHAAYDEGFQGFGYDMTDSEGRYQFRTIKPTNYPGRAHHIHVKVWQGDNELLTTQFYLADYKFNGSDGLYRRLSPEQAERVSMVFTGHNNVLETYVDVVI